MHSTDNGLTQRVWMCSGGGWFSRPVHAASWIVEKWWEQHLIDFDELRGDNLGLTHVRYAWQW
uniref:Uncharacterized protein n=1 Tax=Aegilops tauschii subsp. strangulata TaxID=200361 RepID=A0A453P8M9_AEGTS